MHVHVYAGVITIVSLQGDNSVSYYLTFLFPVQQSRDCLLVHIYVYSCLMPISDRASNKRTHHPHPITPKNKNKN